MLTTDDFYESAECRTMFVEWLTPESLTDETFELVRQHSAGLVPPVVLRVTLAGYCEYLHNVLVDDDVHFDGLIDHLMVELQGVFQSDDDYRRAAVEWLEEADRDMAADWCDRRRSAQIEIGDY
jgi:hypothetical protein